MAKKKRADGKPPERIYPIVGKKIDKNGNLVPFRKNFYGYTKKECHEKYDKYMKQVNAGLNPDCMYFVDLSDEFTKNFFPHYDLATTTQELYLNAWKKHVITSSLATMKIQDVRLTHLQAFYNGLDCSKTGLDNVHKMMRHFYKYLEVAGYARDITQNLTVPKKPVTKRKVAEEGESVVIYSNSELEKIVEALPTYGNRNMRLIIILALNTGLRISELLGVNYTDIVNGNLHVQRQVVFIREMEKKTLTTGELKSSNSNRYIPISKQLESEISIHREKHLQEMLKNNYRTDFIFTSSSGGLLDRHNMNVALERFSKSIGIQHKGFHAFRATFGTGLCKNDVTIHEASKLLGHASIDTTAKYYINVDEKGKRKAVESLDFPMVKGR